MYVFTVNIKLCFVPCCCILAGINARETLCFTSITPDSTDGIQEFIVLGHLHV